MEAAEISPLLDTSPVVLKKKYLCHLNIFTVLLLGYASLLQTLKLG